MAPLVTLIADPRHVLDADGAIRLSEAQARAILELRLARLTALGRDEIAEALNRLSVEIADYLDILSSRVRLMSIIRDELVEVKTEFATPRRTDHPRQRRRHGGRGSHPARGHGRAGQPRRLHQARAALDLSRAEARRQRPRRHGDDATRISSRSLFVASTHQPVSILLVGGQVYKEKVWRLPLAAPQARGKALVNLLPLERTSASPPSCRCPRTRRPGNPRSDVRHHARHGRGATSLATSRR